MKIEQYVMAYGVEHDLLRSIIPEGFISLRPVLRINAGIRDNCHGYLELNTPVEGRGKRGWLNIGFFDGIQFEKTGKSTRFFSESMEITFSPVGIVGGCPAEKDNDGCFFLSKHPYFRKSEEISANKEFCNCSFQWKFEKGAHGVSIGKTLPAIPTEVAKIYPHKDLTIRNAATIPCVQVLGSYKVVFERGSDCDAICR